MNENYDYIYPESNKSEHPSICYKCIYSRKPVAESLAKEGICGCIINQAIGADSKAIPLNLRSLGFDFNNIKASLLGTGWIYSQRNPWIDYTKIKLSGIQMNNCLLTKEVTSCKYHIPRK